MKKFFRFLMAAAVLFGASSCVKEDISSSIAGGEVEITITANLANLGTRAIGEAEHIDRVYLGVYEQNSNTPLTNLVEADGYLVNSDGVASFSVVLLKDKYYDLVFWAQKSGLECYEINWATRTLTIDYQGVASQEENRDAFFLVKNGFHAGHDNTTFVLNRPFAQLNAGLAATDVTNIENNGVSVPALWSEVVVKDVANTLDLGYTTPGAVSGAAPVTFASAAKPTETLTVGGVEYNYLSMNYLLVNEKQNVDITYTFVENGADEAPYVRPYYNVPVQRNYRTNILGNLISSPMEFTVIIDANFNEPDSEVAVWDGTISEPDYDEATQTYSVDNGSELAWLAAAVNGTLARSAGDNFEGKTIVLTGDVELGGHEWTPIGSGAIFQGTFDGGNYTVSNFTVKQQEGHAGLFGNARGTIKNLKVENVEIVAHHYAGAIVGQGYCRIDNCHVKNVNITLTTKNGDWGDKAGGIIGQNCEGTLYVKNSTANNVTIKGYRDLGGIAGMAHRNNTVSGCSASVITIEQDLTVNYEATTPVTLGGVVGRFGANVTYENNTESDIVINGVERVNDGNGNYVGVGSIITVGGQKAVIFSIEDCIKAVSVEELNLNGKNWQNAMDWAAGLGQGWALASIYDLDAIHAVRANLNAALAADSSENALFCETEYVEQGKYAIYLSSTIAEGNDPQGEAYFANRVMLKYFNLNGYWDYNYSTFATINKNAPLKNNYFARGVYTFHKVGSIVECAGQKGIVYEVTADAYKVVSVEQGGEMTWNEAKAWAEGLGNGWSLASKEELQAIYDVRVELNEVLAADSADNALFEEDNKEEDGTYAAYWSSTIVEGTSGATAKAYYIYFDSQCRVTTSFTMFPVEYSRAVYTIAK